MYSRSFSTCILLSGWVEYSKTYMPFTLMDTKNKLTNLDYNVLVYDNRILRHHLDIESGIWCKLFIKTVTSFLCCRPITKYRSENSVQSISNSDQYIFTGIMGISYIYTKDLDCPEVVHVHHMAIVTVTGDTVLSPAVSRSIAHHSYGQWHAQSLTRFRWQLIRPSN